MDPTAALREMRELAKLNDKGEMDSRDADRFVELFDGLDQWLTAGGFLPSGWDR